MSPFVLLALMAERVMSVDFIEKPYITEEDIPVTYVVKRVGNVKVAYWDVLDLGSSDTGYTHYDMDLYRYESVEIACPDLREIGIKMVPISDGQFYDSPYIWDETVIGNRRKHPYYRLKSNIKDVVDTIVVEESEDGGTWTISYVGEPKHRYIKTMYFDCVSQDHEDYKHHSGIQINLMPETDFIPKLETITIERHPYLPPEKNGVYYKNARLGTYLHIKCKKGGALVSVEDAEYSSLQEKYIKSIVEKDALKEHVSPSYRLEDTKNFIKTMKIDVSKEDFFLDDVDLRKLFFYNDKNVYTSCCNHETCYFILGTQVEEELTVLDLTSKVIEETLNSFKRKSGIKGQSFKIYHDKVERKIVPPTCPMHVILANGVALKIDSIIQDLNMPIYTDEVMILETSNYRTYRSHSVHCDYQKNGSETEIGKFALDFPASCNFNNKNSVATDGLTCTVFAKIGETFSLINLMHEDDLHDEITILGPHERFLPHPIVDCPYCFAKYGSNKSLFVTKTINQITNKIEVSAANHSIRHNPVYHAEGDTYELESTASQVLVDVDVDIGTEYASEPYDTLIKATKIITVYLFDSLVIPNANGTVPHINEKTVHNMKNGWRFFSIPMHGVSRLHLNCADFFTRPHEVRLKLYPEGKNTIFKNVNSGEMDPRVIKATQFQDEFASFGISIYKSPETFQNYDLQIVLDDYKGIWSEHIKPIYFICAAEDWVASRDSYAIIALDPGLSSDRLYGCGTRPRMFYTNDDEMNTSTNCEFTLDDKRTIGFYCPTVTPKHFLSGDQNKWAPKIGKSSTTNPYQIMVQCYDRSVENGVKMSNKVDLKLFDPPKEVGELRSLWVFSKRQFTKNGKAYLSKVECECFNESNNVIASIVINAGI
ncbi:hypothetical protein BgAZ_105230 [Babesia gibsoni]|uniref:6-Cys domain-containing protein n=1 Tax=Babesia gibsoni TaxID=33632 RepID=A0AAD8PFW6_BABGI|nr:hypothetical protein BgAZ_105230 [Babesia gibsoni]